MEKKPACYVYAPGQYIGYVRQIARSSIGVTIPISIRRSMKLRPGMEIMVQLCAAKAEERNAPEGEGEA